MINNKYKNKKNNKYKGKKGSNCITVQVIGPGSSANTIQVNDDHHIDFDDHNDFGDHNVIM